MPRRTYWIGVLAWLAVLMCGGRVAGQVATSNERWVVFRVPEGIDTKGVFIDYYLVGGDRAEHSGRIVCVPDVHEYPLEVARGGRPPSSMKAFASRPGYGTALVEVALASSQAPVLVDLALSPLATVKFAGRILFPDSQPPAGLKVAIEYLRTWYCAFYQLMDCLLGPERVGLVPFAADGSFTADVPDYAHDPALGRFAGKGEFSLELRDDRENIRFWLSLDASRHTSSPVAESYPSGRVFYATPR